MTSVRHQSEASILFPLCRLGNRFPDFNFNVIINQDTTDGRDCRTELQTKNLKVVARVLASLMVLPNDQCDAGLLFNEDDRPGRSMQASNDSSAIQVTY